MTTLEAIDKLDLLLDKYGSPYFTQAEKISFLNTAQLEFLNRLVPDSLGGTINYEFDKNTTELLRPLTYTTGGITGGSGTLAIASLDSDLATTTGDVNAKVFRILSVTTPVANLPHPIRFIRDNNVAKFYKNTFKAFTYPNDMGYNLRFSVLQVFPPGAVALDLVVLKYPLILTAGNSPDFDSYGMNQVISIASQLASVGLRDSELTQQIQNSNIAK